MNWLERFISTKFLLTFLCLTAIFVLAGRGVDVRQFEIIIPAILAFYISGNVIQDSWKSQIQAKYSMPPDSGTTETSAGSGP